MYIAPQISSVFLITGIYFGCNCFSYFQIDPVALSGITVTGCIWFVRAIHLYPNRFWHCTDSLIWNQNQKWNYKTDTGTGSSPRRCSVWHNGYAAKLNCVPIPYTLLIYPPARTPPCVSPVTSLAICQWVLEVKMQLFIRKKVDPLVLVPTVAKAVKTWRTLNGGGEGFGRWWRRNWQGHVCRISLRIAAGYVGQHFTANNFPNAPGL